MKCLFYFLRLVLAAAFFALAGRAIAAPLPQDVYLWQRAWTEPVKAAVREHAGSFSNFVVMAAEVDWKNGQPEVIRVPLDYELLNQLRQLNHVTVSLALRVGPYGGKFATNNGAAIYLSSLASSLIRQAETTGLTPGELQLDFDSAEGKLAGYRLWVETLRQKIAPVPLRITVLPVWLKHPEFRALAQAAGGFILQVHSLQRPRSPEAPFTICDPVAAQAAVRLAGQVGVPFRVALPTYGYLVGFTPEGKFLGLSAEGPAKNWPAGAQLREVRSDAPAMAELVQAWASNPPPGMSGIIWYRFPVPGDIFNWRWPTISAMLALRTPQASVKVVTRRAEPGLVELRLENNGELDVVSRFTLTASWPKVRLVASDAMAGFERSRTSSGGMQFQAGKAGIRLAPGDQRLIGWLRFDGEADVNIERESF